MADSENIFLDAVNKRMTELDWTPYKLAIACKGRGMGYTSVYKFLDGTRDIQSKNLAIVFNVLGMGISIDGPAQEKTETVEQ